MQDIKQVIENYMAEKGITRAKICTEIGWHPQTWSKKMTDPKWSTIDKVCGVLGVSLVSLFNKPEETTAYIDCPYCHKPMQIKSQEVKI